MGKNRNDLVYYSDYISVLESNNAAIIQFYKFSFSEDYEENGYNKKFVSALSKNSSLQELYFSECTVPEKLFLEISDALRKNNPINSLYCEETCTTPPVIKSLVNVFSLDGLKRLSLVRCLLVKDEIETLAQEIIAGNKIEYLNISGNTIDTDVVAKTTFCSALESNYSIKELVIEDCHTDLLSLARTITSIGRMGVLSKLNLGVINTEEHGLAFVNSICKMLQDRAPLNKVEVEVRSLFRINLFKRLDAEIKDNYYLTYFGSKNCKHFLYIGNVITNNSLLYFKFGMKILKSQFDFSYKELMMFRELDLDWLYDSKIDGHKFDSYNSREVFAKELGPFQEDRYVYENYFKVRRVVKDHFLPADQDQYCMFEFMPLEIICHICSFLPIPDVPVEVSGSTVENIDY